MSSITCIAHALLLVTPVAVPDGDSRAQKAGLPEQVVLDASRPDTWDAAVLRVRHQQDAIAESLIAVAKDEARNPEERRSAILLLSYVRDARSLEFLIGNPSLEIQARTVTGDADRLKQTPCAYVLAQQPGSSETPPWFAFRRPRHGGGTLTLPYDLGREWSTAHAIILGLDRPGIPKPDVTRLAYALLRILGKEVALAALDEFLKDDVPERGAWRDNLNAVKTYVQHK